MQIYFAITLFVVLLGVFFPHIKESEKEKKIYLLMVTVILSALMGLRNETVGVDTAVSNEFYIRIAQETSFSRYINIINSAPVYSLYNKFLSLLCPKVWFLNIVNALIINACFAYFIYQYSENAVFSIYCYISMYFYLFAFNGTRQSLASALCVLSFCLHSKGKPLKASFLFLSAIGTHLTCIVFFPVFIICNEEKKQRLSHLKLCILAVASLFLKYAYQNILQLFFKIMPSYAKYGEWLEDGRFRAQGRNILVSIFYMFFLMLFISAIWSRHANINKTKTYWCLILPSFIGISMGLLFFKNALISGRVILYFTCFMIVIFPNLVEQFNNRAKFLIYSAIGFCLLFLLYYQLHINYAGVVPYQFFWE